MALQKSIVGALKELKSSVKPNTQKALRAELYALLYLMERGFEPLFFRQKFAGIEADLICRKDKKIYLFEIKYLAPSSWAGNRVSRKQRNRQKKLLDALAYRYEEDLVYFWVFFEEKQNSPQVRFLESVFW